VPLRSKMLTMSTIPVIVLVFAVWYAVSAQRTAEQTNAEVDRTNAVRQTLATIHDDLAVAESSVRGYLLTGRASMESEYQESLAALQRDLVDLDLYLVETLQQRRLERVRELVDERVQTFRAVLRIGRTRTADAQARLDTADELAVERIATRDRAFQRSYLVHVLAMPAAVCTAMILMITFTASIVRRVARMRSNAKRLDQGRPLEEADASHDELGSLSRALVRTGQHLSELQEELRRFATVDDLTGLANRRGFFALGEHELLVAARTRASVAMLFVDVDGLKHVNDELGHAMGDLLLKEAADVIRETIRASDVAGRLGGDEFCVLLMGDPDLDAERVVERLHETAASHNARPKRSFHISLSVGLSALPPGRSVTLEELIDAADEEMYEDKRTKRETQPLWSIWNDASRFERSRVTVRGSPVAHDGPGRAVRPRTGARRSGSR
jgi:diguanylate cyclase (GGDEF)-like protein